MPNKALVIVESPTKAKTIRKFLPKTFSVEASMGHIRDLPKSAAEIPQKFKSEDWAKIGVNVDQNFEPIYVVPKGKSKIIRELKNKMKTASVLFLATDEDREGESISYHLTEVLKPKIPVKRMVFHEITKKAIEHALEDTRDIDMCLVQAQETRRILDRLVGFTLSPLLWKKIAYGLSAGRVQSAGLKLLVEREKERLVFKKSAYFGVSATLEKDNKSFQAKLHTVNNKRIATGKDFDETTGNLQAGKDVFLITKEDSQKLATESISTPWKVYSVEEKDFKSHPTAPFITSTLQQEANRKLGLSAKNSMRIAQRLYEEGLITYMRTDSSTLSQEGINGAISEITNLYGKEYLAEKPRQFSSKSKSAQEAHEAIRPAGEKFVHPKQTGLSDKELALYDLIWKRTIASQMKEAQKRSSSIRFEVGDAIYHSSGTRIVFPGFLKAYVEGSDDPDIALQDKEVILPELKENEVLNCNDSQSTSHETKPKARFTEASIVQKLEKEGVGRPSTYASIIDTLIFRGYVNKVGSTLIPTFTGVAVIQLLDKHFNDLFNINFTSEMERYLDEIAIGKKEWLPYLKEFYLGKNGLKNQVEKKEKNIDPNESRSVHIHDFEGFEIRVGRFGPYIFKKGMSKDDISASIPEDVAPADLTLDMINDIITASEKGPTPIGVHPETKQNIYCLLGRYGPYLQLGEVTEEVPKPKRASVPKPIDYKTISLEIALKLLSLPRELGVHPDTQKPIVANQGRFGPYVMHDGDFRSLKKDDDLYTVDLNRALEILKEEKKGRGGSKKIRDIGNHPDDEKPIAIYSGKYGEYIKYKSKNFSLPKDTDAQKITLEQTLELIGATAKAKKSTKKKKKVTKKKKKKV